MTTDTPSTEPETHISSIVVWVKTDQRDAVIAAIVQRPNLHVHPVEHADRLILTLETPHFAAIYNFIDHLQALPGVLAANMVYHQVETACALAEDLLP